VNILLIIFQSKSMMLKLFWQLQALNPGQNIFWFTWGDLRSFIGILNQWFIVGNDGGANMAKALGKPSLLSSPLDWKENLGYIRRRNPSPSVIHLNDYRPELLSQKNRKELKQNALTYKEFKPTLFKEKLKSFLLNILSN
jgi:heptosyltransferase-2